MSREATRPRDEPDKVLHQLNFWWSEGFQRGVLGGRFDREDGLPAACRDQLFRGLMTGREYGRGK